MRVLWIDTETTGLDPETAGVFEFACIFTEWVKVGDHNKLVTCERDFFLNPLSDKILYSEEAGKIHGVSEEEMRKFQPEAEGVNRIVDFLIQCQAFGTGGKLVFCGYNSKFDWDFVDAMLSRHGYSMNDYFSGRACVFDQVKKGGEMRIVPYLENRKLGTVCKAFGVNLENAHTALADIRATRELAIALQKKGVKLF